MTARTTIDTVFPRGVIVLRSADGSYLLAQQIDAKPLRAAQILEGELAAVGVSSATDSETGATYEFFIEAYGLSRDAALGAVSE